MKVSGGVVCSGVLDGTSVTVVSTEVKYATSSELINPSTIAESSWSTNYPSSAAEGTWIYSRTKVVYSDASYTITYQSSRVGINGNGISGTQVKYAKTTSQLTMPVDDNKVTWYDNYSQLGTLSAGTWIWVKTIISYTNTQTVTNYIVSRVGENGVSYVNTEEFYAIGSSNTTAPTGCPNNTNQPKSYTATAWAETTIGSNWSENKPANPADNTNPYLWNFEVSVYSDGHVVCTPPICIGNFARGIRTVLELYGISSNGNKNNSGLPAGTVYKADGETVGWEDELNSIVPTNTLKFLWNKTIVVYNDSVAVSSTDPNRDTLDPDHDGWKDDTCDVRYHVCGTKGDQGASGTKYQRIYKSLNVYPYPNDQENPNPTGNNPSEWSASPTAISSSVRYRYMSERRSDDGGTTWGGWSAPVVEAYFSEDGRSISIKGAVKGVIAWGESLPSSPTEGDMYLMNNSDQNDIRTRGSSDWTGSDAQMNDGYTLNGHLWVKVAESASATSVRWEDVGQIKGDKGDDALLYTLVCSPDSVNFRSNAVGEFSGSANIECSINKTEGNVTTKNVNVPSGMGLYFKMVGVETTWRSYQSAIVFDTDDVLNGGLIRVDFVLSTSSTITSDSTVASKSVSILLDGRRGAKGENSTVPGPRGLTGKMFYSMGTYSSETEYEGSTYFIPMVYYDNGVWNNALGTTGNYYYLAEGKVGTNITPGTDDTVWIEASSFGIVITQAIFAQFAKLGAFIISGDFFFSQCGTIVAGGSSQAVYEGAASIKRYYNNGVKAGYGFPSYMYFDANDPMAENVEGNTDTYTINGNGEMDCAIVKRIYFYAAQATTLKITVTPSSEAGYDFGAVGLLDKKTLSEDGVDAMTISDGDTPTLVKASGTASDWTTINISQGAHFLEIGYFKDSSSDANQDKATFKFEEVSNSYIGGYSEMKFRPTKVINANTGAEYMASGNFVVNANGVVTMAGNKVIVDQDGNVVMNNIEVNNANIKGSLMFHNIVKSTPNYGYAQLYEAAYEVISGVTYECAPVRLKGDVFLLTGAASTLTESAFTIYLPPASLFVGTSIRIILGTYKTTSSKWEREFCNMKLEVNHPNGCEQRAEDYELIAMNHFAVAMPFTFSNGNAGFGYFERIEYNSYGSIELIATDNPFNSNYKVWMIVDAKE